jgi:E3 ubiquitin-protein ligase RFWD2
MNCPHLGRSSGTALRHFQANVSRFTKYSKFNVFAQLNYGSLGNSSSIVSSIEFDKHDENFATAGVTKEIKIYQCVPTEGLLKSF